MGEAVARSAKFRIELLGSLRVLSPGGDNITPNAAKAKGLIAILADTPNNRRTRRWLESKLWSDRAAQQASGSLRQTLTDIRQSFGEHAYILGSSRQDIWLQSNLISTDFGETSSDDPRTLLEGLDIKDEEFETWLRECRQRRGAAEAKRSGTTPDISKGIRIKCVASGSKNSIERIAGQVLVDQIGKNIESVAAIWRVDEKTSAIGDLEVASEVASHGNECVVYVKITHQYSGRVLFSGFRQRQTNLNALLEDDFVAEFAHEAAGKCLQKLPLAVGLDTPEVVATGFSNLAIKRFGLFNVASLDEADDFMSRAYDASPHGSYLGWRGFFSMARVVDLQIAADKGTLEEVNQLCSQALELSPDSPQTLSLVALTRLMLFDDLESGVGLSEAALRIDPLSMFAKQARSVSIGASGNANDAYEMSALCQFAVYQDELRHLWDLYHSLVCISAGRFEEALKAASRASLRCADFIAPRRQILALSALSGDFHSARKQRQELERLEPSFSLERMVHDIDYPAATLRRAGALDFPLDELED
ncbi:MAG: hypothetical protein AAGA63_11155 [Pseudomonadota bacterium]